MSTNKAIPKAMTATSGNKQKGTGFVKGVAEGRNGVAALGTDDSGFTGKLGVKAFTFNKAVTGFAGACATERECDMAAQHAAIAVCSSFQKQKNNLALGDGGPKQSLSLNGPPPKGSAPLKLVGTARRQLTNFS